MKSVLLACAIALSAAVPGAALADDPSDPAMRNADARARDAAIIKRLNQQQLAQVRQRDAGYAEGWRAWRVGGGMREADARAENARRGAAYEREMAAWRRAVAACEAGRREYCGG